MKAAEEAAAKKAADEAAAKKAAEEAAAKEAAIAAAKGKVGVLSGAETGGKVLPKEEVSADVLNMLKKYN